VNFENGSAYYINLPEVRAVLPGTNFGSFLLDADDDDNNNNNTSRYDMSDIRDAWDTVNTATGRVGDHAVELAVIDGGFDIHPPRSLSQRRNQPGGGG